MSSSAPPPPATSDPKTRDATTNPSSPIVSSEPKTGDAETNPLPSPQSDAKAHVDSDRSDPSSTAGEGAAGGGEGAEGEEEEEESECGFCLFMKGGGCKDAFIAWEDCVEETHKTGEDPVEKCFEVTALLKKCMDAHADYYEPILRAEQAMADAVDVQESESTELKN